MQIGSSTRAIYDNCAYPDRLQESTDPLSYQLNTNRIHNCGRCLNASGAGPRVSYMGFGNSTLVNGKYAVANDNVDVESILSNRNVKLSRCKVGHLNPVNLTQKKGVNYESCGNQLNPEFSRLAAPPSNYRNVATNRFYNLINDPQANIFYDFAHNTRLEAKDNWVPDLPVPIADKVSPVEFVGSGKPKTCGISCQ
ncbi:hypothetical protein BMW23_0491 [Bodo saltans virus]|uniref:Uncharacterized protein n=1 Tax=Bodo saltans virus TaxID=2024608 RepID=A0A2H4UUD0_9VIRU|nr:hypothetical protein QJ851_gp0478 [Bodo saltans virus]ATZ80541.1 hypothetical protein BMW23_0491 [Bodo saltans virus]